MKISRRGKLARRRKHTKRAGKHLRYKTKSKKFSGSKRYHRGNKRTYKRGRRFHRGGEDVVIKFDPSTFDLRYNKHYFTPDTSKFTVTGTIKTNGGIEIRFERYNKKSDDKDKTFVINDISVLTSGDKLKTWISNDGSKYNFNYSENTSTLQKIYGQILSASETKAAAEANDDAATEAKAAAQLKPINDGSLKNNHENYNPPQYIRKAPTGGYDYYNYLGRYTLKFNDSNNQTFDVYFIGYSAPPYRGGFIYLFGVTDADTMQGNKLVYNSGYYIMTSMLIDNKYNKNFFFKLINLYDRVPESEKQQYTLEDSSFIDSIDKKLQKIEKGIALE